MRYVTLVGMIFITFLLFACGSSKKAQEMEGVTAEELFQKGNSEMASGKYQDAVNTYNLILDRFPSTDLHIDVQLKLAEANGELDNFEEQMDILLRLLRENIIPDRVPQIYVQLGKFYERAAQFNPGTVTTDTMDYKKAIAYYGKAVVYKDSEDESAKAEALYRKALTEAKIGLFAQAAEDYRTVTVKYPNELHSLLAQIKLQNPQDTSELAIDEASLNTYRQQLSISAGGQSKSDVAPSDKPSGSDEKLFAPAQQDTSYQE